MVVIGLIGATLLYGDGAITPAISVLSAIEGIKLYAPQMGQFVVPLTVVILVLVFVIQHKGTSCPPLISLAPERQEDRQRLCEALAGAAAGAPVAGLVSSVFDG